jgi:FAD/FMN-containing dehydrogenase
MSGEYGLPCDNIVNYEVVLSNATVVNANSTSNTDLFWALKGGGNQFAVVTKFTMIAIPMGQVWGGTRIYSYDDWSAVMNATHDFTENYTDPKASIIVTSEAAADSLVKFFLVFFYYNGPTPPAGPFDGFDAISAITDSTKAQSYADLVRLLTFSPRSSLTYLAQR